MRTTVGRGLLVLGGYTTIAVTGLLALRTVGSRRAAVELAITKAIAAVTQNVARVEVRRGENGGSTLEHTAIARDLVAAGAVPAAGGVLKTTLKAPPGLTAKDLRIVAFVQERASRRVLGTTTASAPVSRAN